MDKTLLNTCRYTGITKTTDNSSDFRICRICGGVTHKVLGEDRKTVYDLTVDNKVAITEDIIPKINLLHREAYRCSHCGEKLEVYDLLELLIAFAQALHDGAVEGTDTGQYAVGSKDILNTAIEAAQELVVAGASTQDEINTAFVTMQEAIDAFKAGKVNYEGLQLLIFSAQALHDGATEGVDPGQYAVGSKDTLNTAIATAQAVVTAKASTMEEINTATATLQEAIDAFKEGRVPEA